MPAAPESSVTPPIETLVKTLGIIAGGGSLPARLLQACERDGIEPFIVAFDGQTDPAILKDHNYMLTRIGAAGQIINTLKSRGIGDLVFIGKIHRPSLREMRPDLRTLGFFSKLLTRAIGDDGLLKAMKEELEREGFRLHAVQNFIRDLLAAEGTFSLREPGTADQDDIARGLAVLSAIGLLDIGQAVVVQDGIVLGVEAAEGTDNLIRRCGDLRREGRGPILVKISKPGQDSDLDLPTIGPDTIRIAGENKFAGIILQAGRTLLVDPQDVTDLADQFDMFVVAVK